MGPPAPPHWLSRAAAVTGAALLLTTFVVEVLDQAPHLELGLAIGAALALALATIGRSANGIRVALLLAAVTALALAAAKGALVGDGLLAVVLAVPTAGLGVVMLLSAGESARAARALTDERRRARVEGEERERARWARDLHDDTLQELGAIQVLLAAAVRSGEPAAMARALQDASGLLAGQIATLRHLVAELRPLALDQLGLGPSLSTLGRRTAELNNLHVEVAVDVPALGEGGAEQRLPAAVEVAAYRVVQESLRNVVRHAHASQVDVLVAEESGRLVVEVCDDGRGLTGNRPDADAGHFGVRGMRERVELVGGTFTISGGPRGGTRVHAELPLTGRRHADARSRAGETSAVRVAGTPEHLRLTSR